MPDQPDDARKRQQRGVFPPFFAPRNGRGESPPAPASGSWRRISRLFTPPEVARQHRTPSGPQAPFTQPTQPTAEAPEPLEEMMPPSGAAPAAPEVAAPEMVAPEMAAPEMAALPALPNEPPVESAALELERFATDAMADVPEEGSFETPAGPPAGPAAEVDPWAGSELPEPAFGSIGWPSNEIAVPAADRSVEGSTDGVDEMSAALAWSDGDAESGGGAGREATPAAQASGPEAPGEDALSAMAHELRDSSSTWVPGGSAGGSSASDESADVSARARFYGGGERSASAVEPDTAGELDTGALDTATLDTAERDMTELDAATLNTAELDTATQGDPFDAELGFADAVTDTAGAAVGESADDPGAAIADALARIAVRIRAGEVELPSGVVGASDESALAAALAALLKGPRH